MDDPSEARVRVAADNVNGRDIRGRTVAVNAARSTRRGLGKRAVVMDAEPGAKALAGSPDPSSHLATMTPPGDR